MFFYTQILEDDYNAHEWIAMMIENKIHNNKNLVGMHLKTMIACISKDHFNNYDSYV